MKFISEINAYFQAQTPWILAKQNKELFAEVISSTCHSLYAVGVMLWPIMPNKMEQMLAILGFTFDLKAGHEQALRENKWDKTFKLSKLIDPLFIKPESHVEPVATDPQGMAATSKSEAKPGTEIQEIGIEDFMKVSIAVGTILSCQNVEGSEKLYKLEVDFGTLGKRQILSGVAQHFKPEDLIGKQGIAVTNLKPRKMMGMLSHGMMLFAKDSKGALKLVGPNQITDTGSHVA